MILVDTSVWITYFSSAPPSRESEILDDLLGRRLVQIGDLILLELLQGFRTDAGYRDARNLLSAFEVRTLCNPERTLSTADRYRRLRKRGVTIRKTVDVIIASYCIEENVPLLTEDRDFGPFARHFGLQLFAG